MKKYKNLENGITYTTNGKIESKIIMGKSFDMAQCEKSDGTFALVPIEKLKDKTLYECIN